MAVNWEGIKNTVFYTSAEKTEVEKEKQRLLHGGALGNEMAKAMAQAKADQERLYQEVQQEKAAKAARAAMQAQQGIIQQRGYGQWHYTFPLSSAGAFNGMAFGIGMDRPIQERLVPPPVNASVIEKLKAAEPRKVHKRMPDSIDMITGWRAWRTVIQHGEWRLKAIGQEVIWEPKKKMSAECVGVSISDPCGILAHPAPLRSCSCGVWAFKNIDLLPDALMGQTNELSATVIGSVDLWGHVIETDIGFRAQYAYPKELWLFKDGMEELGLIYGVPIRTLTAKDAK